MILKLHPIDRKKIFSTFVSVLILIFLAACGAKEEAQGFVELEPTVEESNSSPSINVSSPSNGGNQNIGSTTNFTATASDAEDGNLTNNIEWSSNIDGILGTGGNISVQLSQGSHLITAKITDSGNITNTDFINFQINGNNSLPSISITTPINNGNQNTGTTTNLSATASDTEDGDLSSNIQWASNIDGALGTGASITAQLSQGSHQITATVVDSNNNSTNDSINYQINATNSAPVVSITSPSDGSSNNSGQSITFTATANDAEDGSITSSIRWTSDIDGDLGTGGSISVQLSDGAHTITAQVVDSGNRANSTNINVSLNASYGVATVSWTAPTQNTDDSALTDLTGFKIYYGTSANNLTNSVTIDSSTTTTKIIGNLNIQQTYYFAVVAINALGIESEQSTIASKLISS